MAGRFFALRNLPSASPAVNVQRVITPIKAGTRIGAVANDSQTDRAGLNAAQNALFDQLNDWNWNDDSNTAYSTALTHPHQKSRGINLTPRWNIRRRTCAASRAAASRTERRVRQDDGNETAFSFQRSFQ